MIDNDDGYKVPLGQLQMIIHGSAPRVIKVLLYIQIRDYGHDDGYKVTFGSGDGYK